MIGAAVRFLVPLALALSSLGGCGSTDNGVTVAGTVTIGPAPLAHGVVRFTPASGTPVAAGVVAGKYEARVPPGQYTVTVEATSAPAVGTGSSEDRTKTKGAPPLATIPAKYRTGVSVDIAGSNPALDFDLSK